MDNLFYFAKRLLESEPAAKNCGDHCHNSCLWCGLRTAVENVQKRDDRKRFRTKLRVRKFRKKIPSNAQSNAPSNASSNAHEVFSLPSPPNATGPDVLFVSTHEITDAFDMIGCRPFGDSTFQALFAVMCRSYDGSWARVMGNTIAAATSRNIVVPPKFVDLCKEVEWVEGPKAKRV